MYLAIYWVVHCYFKDSYRFYEINEFAGECVADSNQSFLLVKSTDNIRKK